MESAKICINIIFSDELDKNLKHEKESKEHVIKHLKQIYEKTLLTSKSMIEPLKKLDKNVKIIVEAFVYEESDSKG